MTDAFHIAPVATPDDLAAVAALFRGYAESLPVDLGYQDFAAELAGLPGKYAPPEGALLLARDAAGAPLGCVGLRPLGEGVCEIKRLYLLPAARGLGLGRALSEAVIAEALGFERIAPYYAPTPLGTVFMALNLQGAAS